MATLALSVETADAADAARVLDGLLEYNRTAGGADYAPFAAFARDAEGQVIGGMLGYARLGCLFIEKFWIEEAHRKDGLGSRLMTLAESEARARGCHLLQLDTYSFQALPFYVRHGFRELGRLEGFRGGHSKHFLAKELAA